MIEKMRELCSDEENVYMTYHVSERIRKRNISSKDILNVIMGGEIIENYPEDYPFPSALIFGFGVDKRILHVVAGVGSGKLWIITAYYPDDRWESDFKTRKAEKL